MYIFFYILCAIAGFFIVYVLGVQFYKLGKILKERFPIIYRIYTIFWTLVGTLVLVGVLVGLGSAIEDYQERKRMEKLDVYLNLTQNVKLTDGRTMLDQERISGFVEESRSLGGSELEIYNYIKNSENDSISTRIKEAKDNGYTDKEIARRMGIYL